MAPVTKRGQTWKPKKRDFERAWKLYQKGRSNGGSQKEIAAALKISLTTYRRNLKAFRDYFRDMGRGSRGRPKGDRKVDPRDIDLDMIRKFLLTGYSYRDIAKWLGIHEDTFREYRKEYEPLRHICDTAVMEDTAEIFVSLGQRARGFEHDAVHFSSYQGDVTETEYTKKYPPDTEAARLILTNRIGFKRDVDPQGENNRGAILEALDALMDESDDEGDE